jgi:hypothetical protein
MLKILFTSAVLALVLCGCSKKDDGAMNDVKNSAAKAIDSAKDAVSNAGDAAKDAAQDAARSVQESARDVTDSAATAGHKAMNKAADEVKEAHSVAAREWNEFRAMVKKCGALTSAERKQCMADARDMYLASDFKCGTLSGSDKTQCLKYAQYWKSATANPKAAVTHTEEPTMTPASPGDPSASERNRDSTKQQQDAAGTLPESKKQN